MLIGNLFIAFMRGSDKTPWEKHGIIVGFKYGEFIIGLEYIFNSGECYDGFYIHLGYRYLIFGFIPKRWRKMYHCRRNK